MSTADIVRAFRNEAVMKILVDDSKVQSGPFDGGCLIVAKAFKNLFPEGRIVHISFTGPNGKQHADHYGLRLPDKMIIDAAGLHESADCWIAYLNMHEGMRSGRRVRQGILIDPDIDDPTAVNKLTTALQKVLENKL